MGPALMDAPVKAIPVLAPSLLVSMPQLHDPNFERSVILLCEHGEHGAFGLVLNRRTNTPASAVVRLSPPVSADSGLELGVGGPVEPARG
ncbi:MAG: YqgE/AlgH family protein, partial [Acidobacteria bacterium]|nr:YqgE/AlgH family protein [Acidobacteriota bacterium]